MTPNSLLRSLSAALMACLLLACGSGKEEGDVLRVGGTTGPHAEILEVVKAEAERRGLTIRIVEFTDYVQPNVALNAGDLDANSYQHLPYLESTNAQRGTALASIGQTFAAPIAFYSRRFERLDELPDGAQVAIPNDPSNSARTLLLLQTQGLIELDAAAGIRAGLQHITANPKKLRFVELDAAQLPRSLDDVDAAAVNTNYALEAGLDPVRDSIARESRESPYVNVLAVRESEQLRPALLALLSAYHSEPVKHFILEKYQGALIPAW